MAFAQSMIEYIASHLGCITLFSTHYQELTMLSDLYGIQNVHASAAIDNDHIVFLYKIKEGNSNRSYGINVAKLAKLPNEVIERADLILKSLENNDVRETVKQTAENKIIIKESEAEKMLKQINPMELSPLDALSTLIELKKLCE